MDKKFKSKARTLWENMIRRCSDPKSTSYKYYGGKGVTVCSRWNSNFNDFFEDLPHVDGFDLEMFMKGLIFLDKDLKQPDRRNKVYSLDTCTFMTREENNRLAGGSVDFYVILPDGTVGKGDNLNRFCIEHGITSSHALLMRNGGEDRRSIKGYQFFKEYPSDDEVIKRRYYEVESEDGSIEIYYSHSEIAQAIGISASGVSKLVRKGYRSRNGYRVKVFNPDGYHLMVKNK